MQIKCAKNGVRYPAKLFPKNFPHSKVPKYSYQGICIPLDFVQVVQVID